MSVLPVFNPAFARQSLSAIDVAMTRLSALRPKHVKDTFTRVGFLPDRIPLGSGWQQTLERWIKAAARRDLRITRFSLTQIYQAAERDAKATNWLYKNVGNGWKRLLHAAAAGCQRAQTVLPHHNNILLNSVKQGHRQFEQLFRHWADKDWLMQLLGMATIYGPFYGLLHPTHFAAYAPLAMTRFFASIPVSVTRYQKTQIDLMLKMAEKQAEDMAHREALGSLSSNAAKKILRLDISR